MLYFDSAQIAFPFCLHKVRVPFCLRRMRSTLPAHIAVYSVLLCFPWWQHRPCILNPAQYKRTCSKSRHSEKLTCYWLRWRNHTWLYSHFYEGHVCIILHGVAGILATTKDESLCASLFDVTWYTAASPMQLESTAPDESVELNRIRTKAQWRRYQTLCLHRVR